MFLGELVHLLGCCATHQHAMRPAMAAKAEPKFGNHQDCICHPNSNNGSVVNIILNLRQAGGFFTTHVGIGTNHSG